MLIERTPAVSCIQIGLTIVHEALATLNHLCIKSVANLLLASELFSLCVSKLLTRHYAGTCGMRCLLITPYHATRILGYSRSRIRSNAALCKGDGHGY